MDLLEEVDCVIFVDVQGVRRCVSCDIADKHRYVRSWTDRIWWMGQIWKGSDVSVALVRCNRRAHSCPRSYNDNTRVDGWADMMAITSLFCISHEQRCWHKNWHLFRQMQNRTSMRTILIYIATRDFCSTSLMSTD